MSDLRSRKFTLEDRYRIQSGTVFLTGVQALVRLALDQRRADRAGGIRSATFVSGYPGSPLAGFDTELNGHASLLGEHDIVHRPGVNEELAATAVYGSQTVAVRGDARWDGVVGMWYGKAPGLDRASDAIKHANLVGTAATGGALLLCGDDAIAKSSTVPSASETTFFDLGIPFVAPADPQEVIDLGLHAVALSRTCGLWVGLKMATNVADGSATVAVGPDRVTPIEPALEPPWRHQVQPKAFGTPQILELESSLHGPRMELARAYAAANTLNVATGVHPDDQIGIIAAGKTFVDVREALERLGIDGDQPGVRLLKLGMPYPLESEAVREFARGLDLIIVVEEKRAFIELLVKDVLQGRTELPPVIGRRDRDGATLVPAERELDPDVIARGLRPMLAPDARLAGDRPALVTMALPLIQPSADVPARLPYFCSGCPHSASTQVPEGALVGGGIGCHAMVTLMSPERVGEVMGLTQMGGEGAQWLGMSPFVEATHLFQNLGDGTLSHSGTLAIRAAVAAGDNITYKVLANSAVAMTGGQQATGGMAVPAMVESFVAEGVSKVVVTTEEPQRYDGVRLAGRTRVVDRARIVDVQRELATVPGVTVLIHDQECAAEKRRKRKRGLAPKPRSAVFINERVCEGCGDCGAKSNCLSVRPVETEFGRKTQIHQASCNSDLTCLDGDCPSFITVTPGRGRARQAASPVDTSTLPTPDSVIDGRDFGMRIAGIGGTGVVTTAQIIATAAMLEGRQVRGLDQTGLAQKGGPVISDVRISADRRFVGGKLPQGACDLYLACDLLVAAEARQTGVLSTERSVAIVATAEVPTGTMVVDPSAGLPAADPILAQISSRVRADRTVACDAHALCERLFGNEQSANIFLLGVAYQSGALPVGTDAVERAITLNGAAVEANIEAFRRGRQFVCDRAALEATLAELSPRVPPPAALSTRATRLSADAGAVPGSDLEKLISVRVAELIAYQDERYAAKYVRVVAQAAAAERAIDDRTTFSEAVAVGLHKLMAYKDEYEVARLHLDPAMRARITAEFGDGARSRIRLHPPLLRALGMQRKIALGRWFDLVLVVLRAARRLRGTPFDLFGYTKVRRLERRLIAEYRRSVEHATANLSTATRPAAIELATLPDLVRGYEEIKIANAARFIEELTELRGQLDDGTLPKVEQDA